jgi:hypothetical protein
MVVQNLTRQTQSIVPEEVARHNKTLRLHPWESISLKWADWLPWEDDQSMESALRRGIVVCLPANTRPRPMPQPSITGISDPVQLAVCRDLVCGSQERFDELVSATVDKDERRQDFILYYAEVYPVILAAALKWLQMWGPPEALAERVERLEARLQK